MTILNSIWRELQNEPQLDYATAMNSSRIHHFFVTETRNRKPNNRGIHNRNRNFKNRARILISDNFYKYTYYKILDLFQDHFKFLWVVFLPDFCTNLMLDLNIKFIPIVVIVNYCINHCMLRNCIQKI